MAKVRECRGACGERKWSRGFSTSCGQLFFSSHRVFFAQKDEPTEWWCISLCSMPKDDEAKEILLNSFVVVSFSFLHFLMKDYIIS